MIRVAALVAVLLAGCTTYPAVVQPRALAWGLAQPSCLFVCIGHMTITDAESGAATTTVTSSETISPSGSVSVGGGGAKVQTTKEE